MTVRYFERYANGEFVPSCEMEDNNTNLLMVSLCGMSFTDGTSYVFHLTPGTHKINIGTAAFGEKSTVYTEGYLCYHSYAPQMHEIDDRLTDAVLISPFS